ncbi:YIP1 family protein [Cypionkella sp.]|uniref:YIP1 family protein n=1 Tax=Cypionkella sp. TaxID=2811411 RepID=UPI0037520219
MQIDLVAILQAAQQTVKAPRAVARSLIDQQFPASFGWMAIALAVVLSTVLSVLSGLIAPMEADPGYATLFASPMSLALMQALLLMMSLMFIQGLGRAMGGRGQLSDALVLLAWLEGILILIQVVQLVLLLVSPVLAVLLGIASFVVFLRVLAHFIAELHGFTSAGKVLGMILLTFLVVSFLMAAMGIGLPAGAASHV